MWGPSDFDTRHVAVINFIYELPFFKGSKGLNRTLLGGWQVSGVTQFQTGTPGKVATGDDFAGVGTASGAQFWQINGNVSTTGQFTNPGETSTDYFDVKPNAAGRQTLYPQPAAGTFARDRLRNNIYGPGFQNWNLSAFKKLPDPRARQLRVASATCSSVCASRSNLLRFTKETRARPSGRPFFVTADDPE